MTVDCIAIYLLRPIPAWGMHMHAPQNKASSLGGALQRLHSLLRVHPAVGRLAGFACLSAGLFSSGYKVILGHVLASFVAL